MGPPSSFFLAVVAIVILAFAILSFISAVNYKNVSNNDTEGDSISKDTANSLSTTMIIFGIVMLIAFIWIVYVIFVYDNKDKSGIDPRDASLLAKANESIYKLKSVKESYNKLQSNYKEFRDKTDKRDKEKSAWNYCPSPRIKLNIKNETGEVIQQVYGKDGKVEALIIKPKLVDETNPKCKKYKKLDFEVETQPCYELKSNDNFNKPNYFGSKYGQGISSMTQTLGSMTQTMNPMNRGMMNQTYGQGISSMNQGMNQGISSTNPMIQNSNNFSGCDANGFLTKKTVEVPGISFSGGCGSNTNTGNVNQPSGVSRVSPNYLALLNGAN